MKLESIGQATFFKFGAMSSKITKKLLSLALPDKIHLISPSPPLSFTEAFRV